MKKLHKKYFYLNQRLDINNRSFKCWYLNYILLGLYFVFFLIAFILDSREASGFIAACWILQQCFKKKIIIFVIYLIMVL